MKNNWEINSPLTFEKIQQAWKKLSEFNTDIRMMNTPCPNCPGYFIKLLFVNNYPNAICSHCMKEFPGKGPKLLNDIYESVLY